MSFAEDQGPPVLDWRNAIGDFILAFAGCEHWTHAYIRDFGPSVIQQSASSMEINSRAALAKAVLLEKTASPDLKRRIESIFASLAALTTWRHLVVHNSPSFETPQQVATIAEARMHIVSSRNQGKKLTLPGLRKHVVQAEALVSDMWALYLAVSPPHPGKPKAVFSDGKTGALYLPPEGR